MSSRTFPPVDLPVVVPSWEIECCAPPPILGEFTLWRLVFEPVPTPDPESPQRIPGSVTELLWDVEPWPAGGDGRALYRNDIAAYRYQSNGPIAATPPAGRQPVRGMLFGTRHGGSEFDGFPTVSATVNRIQVISCDFRQHERSSTPIPGSTRLKDVQRSPKWFARRHRDRRSAFPSTAAGSGAGG